MINRPRLYRAVVIMLLFAPVVRANEDLTVWSASYRGTHVVFKVAKAATALAENRGDSSSLHERDKDVLELKLPGEVYTPPFPLVTTKAEANQSNPLAAAHAWRAAQLVDDAQWITNTFASLDQPELQQWLTDSELRKKNRTLLKRQRQSAVQGWVALHGYVVLIVRWREDDGHSYQMAETYVKEQGRWKRTNALSSDPGFDIVFSAVDHGSFALAEGE